MQYPALDVSGADADLVLAAVDDFGPSAVEELPSGISIFFTTRSSRDAASGAVASAFPDATISARDVDDEDWARRSQRALTPVIVGRIIVTPPWCAADVEQQRSAASCGSPESMSVIVHITPSMGFGTGHHATTRLCLAALQTLDLRGKTVLDVGTGSGVLALAAALLGAQDTRGIDFDPDAIMSARENLEANPDAHAVVFETVDLRNDGVRKADVVLANLTGATIIQSATMLKAAVAPGGSLILSGVQVHERDEVHAVFAPAQASWVQEESGWVGMMFNDWVVPAV